MDKEAHVSPSVVENLVEQMLAEVELPSENTGNHGHWNQVYTRLVTPLPVCAAVRFVHYLLCWQRNKHPLFAPSLHAAKCKMYLSTTVHSPGTVLRGSFGATLMRKGFVTVATFIPSKSPPRVVVVVVVVVDIITSRFNTQT